VGDFIFALRIHFQESVMRNTLTYHRSIPKQTLRLQSKSVHELAYDIEGKIDRSAVDEFLDRIREYSDDLGDELNHAVSILMIGAIEAGFIAGWQACRNPESMIFEEGRP
jgi:hypothetical protein